MSQNYVETLTQIGTYSIVCLMAHWPCNWTIKKIIKKWKPDQEGTPKTSDQMGAFIGTLERVLIIILVGLGAFTAVGFVAAMKSIARYEKIQKERAFAEYFLAGTMMSLLLALILALLARSLTKLLLS